MKYPFVARSLSDPNGDIGGLGFRTLEAAQNHANLMNSQIDQYPNGGWNVEFWKLKPQEWRVLGAE